MIIRILQMQAMAIVAILIDLVSYINCSRVTFHVLMPHSSEHEKEVSQAVLKNAYVVLQRNKHSNILKNNYGSLSAKFSVLNQETPGEILDVFCQDLFNNHSRVNTIMYLDLRTGRSSTSSKEYILNIASTFGVPVFSWDPDFAGALQNDSNSRVLQMAPTIFHQSQAIIQLMQKYNWTDFAVVTTTSSDDVEFINSIQEIVNRHNDKISTTRVNRLTILSNIIIKVNLDDDDDVIEQTMMKELRKQNKKENRVFLLHTGSREAKNMLGAAEKIGLVGLNYVWILTSTSIGAITKRTSAYPLGTLGVTFTKMEGDKDEDNNVIKSIESAIKVWAKALVELAKKRERYNITPVLSCNTSSNFFWNQGGILFRYMKNYIWEDVPPVRFTQSGVNEFVTLKIVNVQKKTEHNRVYTVWTKVGRWTPQVEKKKAVMGLEMHDVTWPGGALFPPKGKPEKRYFRIVTLKEKPYVIYRETGSETQQCSVHEVPCRLVYDPTEHGNDSTLANNTVSRCCAGLCIDLLRILSERMRFDYTLYEVPDQTWGLPDELAYMFHLLDFPNCSTKKIMDLNAQIERTGEWNGLIRQIMDGKADMIFTSLKITPKRNEHIAFSVPFLETGIAIVVSIRKGAISPTAFLEPISLRYFLPILLGTLHAVGFTIFILNVVSDRFTKNQQGLTREPYDYPSWCLILVFSVHATGASIFIYEWLSPRGLDRGRTSLRDGHRFSLFRSLWLIWAMLFGASVSTDTPRGVSSRFLANIWALFALVFLASYTANLAAFMITKDVHFHLSGIKDIKLTNPYTVKPPFRFGTIPNGSTEENIRENHPRMYEYMKQYPQVDVDTAIQALKDRRIEAFIYDATPLEYRAGNVPDCDLKTVGDVYAATGYGIGLPLDSDLKEEINSIILELQESGEMERLRKFWLAGACHRKRKRGQSSHTIGILNFTSAFILLACGMVIGVALLVFEHVYFQFGRSCLKKMDKGNCCSLISLSMGRSLTFEQSVIEAIGQHKRNKCKDPLCETQLWKVKHELDLALIRIDKLKGQLQSFGIKPEEGSLWKNVRKHVEIKPNGVPRFSQTNDDVFESQNNSEENLIDKKFNDSSNESTLTSVNRRSIRRSPSYTNAVTLDDDRLKHLQKVRFHEGKYYVEVNTDTHSADISSL